MDTKYDIDYHSPVDFSNEALQAGEKGLERLLNGIAELERIHTAEASDKAVKQFVDDLRAKCYEALNDDFQTQVISYLFEVCRQVIQHAGVEK